MSASKTPARLKRPVSITHGSQGDNSGQDSDGETIVYTPGTSIADSQSVHSASTFSNENSGQRTPTASEMSGSVIELGGPAKSTVEGKFVDRRNSLDKLDSKRGADGPAPDYDSADFQYWKEMHEGKKGPPGLRLCYKHLGPGITFKLAGSSIKSLHRQIEAKQTQLNKPEVGSMIAQEALYQFQFRITSAEQFDLEKKGPIDMYR